MILHEIEKVCNVASGIKTAKITTVDNVSPTGSHAVINSLEVFYVYFRRNTASYRERLENTDQNKKITQEISFFLPGRRSSVELLIEKIINKRIVVIYTDWDGVSGVMYKASMTYEYGTGRKRTDGNGYDMKFVAEKIVGSLNYEGVSLNLPDPGDPWEGAVPGILLENTWVLVEPEPILAIPPQTGNTEYLNRFVVAPNGIKYFIDKTGRAMAFPMMPQYTETWTGNGTDEITVTGTLLNDIDPQRYTFIFLNELKLMYTPDAPTDERYFTIESNKLKFGRVIEDWETVQLYSVPNFL